MCSTSFALHMDCSPAIQPNTAQVTQQKRNHYQSPAAQIMHFNNITCQTNHLLTNINCQPLQKLECLNLPCRSDMSEGSTGLPNSHLQFDQKQTSELFGHHNLATHAQTTRRLYIKYVKWCVAQTYLTERVGSEILTF